MVKRKDGRWQEAVTIEVNGRPKVKYFYGKTKTEVTRKIAEYKEEKKNDPGPLFSEIAEEWWEQHEPTLSPTTVDSYKRPYRRMMEHFRETPIQSITPPILDRWISDQIHEHNMARSTASNMMIVIRQIFIYAVRVGAVPFSPAGDLRLPRNLKKEKRTMPESNDIAKIKASVDCTFGLFAIMALYTGLRRGELLGLRWEDIDLKERTLRVERSWICMNSKPTTKEPKTETGKRTVLIPDKLLPHLHPGTGYVFGGDHLLTESQFHDLYDKYRRESGVTCSAHQLRHAYATMLYEANISVKDAQSLLGHAQASTTQDIYTDIRASRVKALRDVISCVDIV